jgi:hypothetical protein
MNLIGMGQDEGPYEADVERVLVRFAVDGDCTNTELLGGADNATRDLATDYTSDTEMSLN